MMTRAIVMVMLMVAAACSAPPERREAERQRLQQDAAIAAKVKAALIREAPMAAAAIDVDVREGVVYLRGFSETRSLQKDLGSIARRAAKGRELVIELQVK